jgi:hypothetical protein
VNLCGWDGGLPGTTWLELALSEVGISGDGDLGNSTSGSSTNDACSRSNSKGGGGVSDRSILLLLPALVEEDGRVSLVIGLVRMPA